MKRLKIKDNLLNFHKLPYGQISYEIDWKLKPHRNQFIKRTKTRINISIEKDIWICETLTTQKLWEDIMTTNPSNFKGENKPIENISYNDISIFFHRLNTLTNQNFRLLKESEFNYACILNYEDEFNDKLEDIIWFENNSNNKTQPISSKPLGRLNLSDLLGNLNHFVDNDITSLSAEKCLYKGASWATQRLWVDKDYSLIIDKKDKNSTIGFRIALI
jgi:hypothetical protein